MDEKLTPALRLIRLLMGLLGVVIMAYLIASIYPNLRLGTAQFREQLPKAWDSLHNGRMTGGPPSRPAHDETR